MNQTSLSIPSSTGEAFARLNAVTTPTVEDLKLMVYVEAGGQGFYDVLAANAPNDKVRDILSLNGREEMGHAMRVCKAIKVMSGEDFAPPKPEDNPLRDFGLPRDTAVTREFLEHVAGLEVDGDKLYEGWAQGLANPDAAKLLRLNAREETAHSKRLHEAVTLL
jgi:rubrerythrin